jgi:predicted Zn-dependent protease
MSKIAILAVAALAPLATAQLAAAQHPCMPPGMSHEEHMKQMSQRGNPAMGFDQDKVSHHFHLTPTGGSIEVSVKQDGDEVNRQQIRDHLKTISREFANGVFTAPIATHAEVPPGVSVMRERKARIAYTYEETPNGGRVLIGTTDRKARKSVHSFLRYQIREHATGDPLTVD